MSRVEKFLPVLVAVNVAVWTLNLWLAIDWLG